MIIDLIKISFLLALGYCLFFISWGILTITDDSEVNKLIELGYIPAEYTGEDIFKFCNPKTESEEEALDKAPTYTMTCLTRGGWS
jgi:hypothetical protein